MDFQELNSFHQTRTMVHNQIKQCCDTILYGDKNLTNSLYHVINHKGSSVWYSTGTSIQRSAGFKSRSSKCFFVHPKFILKFFTFQKSFIERIHLNRMLTKVHRKYSNLYKRCQILYVNALTYKSDCNKAVIDKLLHRMCFPQYMAALQFKPPHFP